MLWLTNVCYEKLYYLNDKRSMDILYVFRKIL